MDEINDSNKHYIIRPSEAITYKTHLGLICFVVVNPNAFLYNKFAWFTWSELLISNKEYYVVPNNHVCLMVLL